jgi:hypothetical protein
VQFRLENIELFNPVDQEKDQDKDVHQSAQENLKAKSKQAACSYNRRHERILDLRQELNRDLASETDEP